MPNETINEAKEVIKISIESSDKIIKYTFNENSIINFSGEETVQLFGFFDSIIKNPAFKESTYKVEDVLSILNLHKLLSIKLQNTISSGVAIPVPDTPIEENSKITNN